MALRQHPTIADLRMRIAETRIKQHRVARVLDISDGHLSHLLSGRKPANAELIKRIAAAIEDVARSEAA